MLIIEDIYVSDEIRDIRFCCDLQKCKGSCCIEGDAGAPLEEEEVAQLEDYIEEILPFMMDEGKEIVLKSGIFDYDEKGELVTSLIENKECLFVYYEKNIVRCAIEKAFEEGKIQFRKPISCHLYPVRILKNEEMEAVNYEKWHICQPARTKGKSENIPLYRFLEDPLTRKYGGIWYQKLVDTIEK